jgi:hypothetical protein
LLLEWGQMTRCKGAGPPEKKLNSRSNCLSCVKLERSGKLPVRSAAQHSTAWQHITSQHGTTARQKCEVCPAVLIALESGWTGQAQTPSSLQHSTAQHSMAAPHITARHGTQHETSQDTQQQNTTGNKPKQTAQNSTAHCHAETVLVLWCAVVRLYETTHTNKSEVCCHG